MLESVYYLQKSNRILIIDVYDINDFYYCSVKTLLLAEDAFLLGYL